jgi:hypothetical protein
VQTLPEAKVGTPAPVSWKATNNFAAVDGKLKGGSLGSAKSARPSIAQGATQTSTVVVPAGAERLDAVIGSPADIAADLDLTVKRDGAVVGSSAGGDSEESVTLTKPAAGTYTIEVTGYSVPSGTTAYDYRDVFFSGALGSVTVDEAKQIKLGSGDSAQVDAKIEAKAPAAEGRELFGEVSLLNAGGTAAGSGSVKIEKVTP